MKEKEIQKSILDWLAYKKKFCYRNNSGGFIDERNHYYKFGTVGSPDIVCVIDGQYVGIEVKTPKGKLNDNQRIFQADLEAAGGKYLVARSIDDVTNL